MAITLPGTHDSNYYNDSTTFGQYQFLTLEEVVKTFLATYVGVGKICENIRANDVYFHATRALQEFSYDTLRSVKSQEITVPSTLQMILPRDFVNQVKIAYSDSSGVKHILYPSRGITSNPVDVTEDETTNSGYSFTNNALNTDNSSTTWENYKAATPNENLQDDYNDDDYKSMTDERYGIDPQHAQINGSFFIDNLRGLIKFGSTLAGETVTLHYVSDGLGTDSEMVVHKFCEEACYKHIAYGILSTRSNVPEYLVQRYKKERFAETRKAKIRLSNIKIEEFAQVLKGMSKQIK